MNFESRISNCEFTGPAVVRRVIRNSKFVILNCLCLLLLGACATTQRTVEPLPGENHNWDHTGYDNARLSIVAIVVENATGDAFGGVDGLFVNTGGPPAGGFFAFDDRAWQDAFALLVLSGVRLVRAVAPLMRTRGGGSIVFSTSSSVREPIPNLTLSNVVRAAVPALAKTLAVELAGDKIRVNNLMPGRIDTDRVRHLDRVNAERQGLAVADVQARYHAAIPLGRYGVPDEYARAAVFLLSDAAAYITGATLLVDGGQMRSVM